MNKNVGGIDRAIRIIAGLILIGLELTNTSPFSPWGWIGVLPLLTALVGWCPPYAIFGLSTRKAKNS